MVKRVKIHTLDGTDNPLDYWLSVSPEKRVEAVEILRKQINGSSKRLQRTVKVIQQA